MRWALYVSLVPAWFDPGDVVGVLTPFWVLYALHDALVKPMPGNHLTPSLAESWTVSPDQRTYEFKLREGVKFHNGDPFTSEDVKFSFERAKSKALQEKVREVTVVGPYRVRFQLHEPWPDFMAFYGTFVSGAGWVVPKKYVEQVGPDGFKKHPIGLGPLQVREPQPGVELVMEAYEGYWRKMPSVKRLVFKSVPESTTRLAMLKRGEVDLAYLLDTPQAEEVKRDPNLKLAFSGGIGTVYLDFLDQWDPKSPWNDQRVRLAASLAIDRKAHQRGRDPRRLQAERQRGAALVRVRAPARAASLRPSPGQEAAGRGRVPQRLRRWRPASLAAVHRRAEAVGGYLGAVGIRTRIRTMERAAFYSALATKKLHGVCMCVNALYGNASSRLSETVPSEGAYAYGAYPDIEALYRQQARETDNKKRQAMLHQIQQMIYDRVRFASIYDYIWASGVGPRVEEPALLLIDPYPWSAPLEEVKLKRK